jgi:hypothetical protein
LAEVGDFIKQSTELQKWGPCWSKVWHVKNIILINRIYFVYPILWSNCNFLCFLCFVCNSEFESNNIFILSNGISSIKSGLFNIILLNKLFLGEWLAVHFKKKWYSCQRCDMWKI